MKSILKKIVSFIVRHDMLWRMFSATMIRIVEHAKWERNENELSRIIDVEKELKLLSPNRSVLNGPFKGMIYPCFKSAGGALAPKIIGSYERELHPIIESICNGSYSEIVDIGCAEGYYAVGFAVRIRHARVFAYDINEKAILLCKELASINNARDRLVTGSFCDARTLQAIPFTGKALIISDCEGYEKDLFIEELVPSLARHDLLIEAHDMVDIEISSVLRQRFEHTHLITSIRSVDDIMKVHLYDYEELRRYSPVARKILLAEGRSHIMEWLYMTSRMSST